MPANLYQALQELAGKYAEEIKKEVPDAPVEGLPNKIAYYAGSRKSVLYIVLRVPKSYGVG